MVPVVDLPNSGIIPFYQMRFMFSWLLLIPIILIEGLIIARGLRSAFLKALGVATLANIVSTLVGAVAAIGGFFSLFTFVEFLGPPKGLAFLSFALENGPLGEIIVDLAIAFPMTIFSEFLVLRRLFRASETSRVLIVTLLSNGITYA
ncbi:MAG: hypothetical protein N2556_02790, partial [Anaerolineae bacterium]|nr:hypothetical protein [Anaerolineae bacterium]